MRPLARQFELAAERQRPYLRLIEEVRLAGRAAAFESRANEAMLQALMGWVGEKMAAIGVLGVDVFDKLTIIQGAHVYK